MYTLPMSFMGMGNPFAGPSYIPFNQIMTRPFGVPGNTGMMNFSGMPFGGATNIMSARMFMNPSGLNQNIFANSTINTNGISITNRNANMGNNNASFTGINNPFTGTRIAQLSRNNGISDATRTIVSGDDIESVNHTRKTINSPFFRGTQTETRVEDDRYVYNIRRTRGTGWIA